ncbi:MAG TPA: PilZ domain-containing protein [Nitrospirota bacterium]
MTDKEGGGDPAAEARKGFTKRYARYKVPDFYRKYIGLKIGSGDAAVDVNLFNFSRHGLMFRSKAPFEAESMTECVISASQFLTKDITFRCRVKFCLPREGSYEIGAEIEAAADATWFDIFTEVHDFIMKREGIVY